MPLTPIPIRGKRKTPWTKPPKVFHLPQKARRTVADVRARRGITDRLTLEALPTEILELILLYSANVALPRASPLIGRKLSDMSTRLRFMMGAFHDTWNQWFGVPADRTVCYGPWPEGCEAPQGLPCAGDFELQSQVLELPWVTVDFILRAQQTWSRNFARHRWYQHLVPWVDSDHEAGHSRKGGFGHFSAHECFEADYNQALEWPLFERPVQWGGYDIHPLTRIPTGLITGPWDDEKQRRLFWLVRGGIALGSDQRPPVPWEMKLDSLRNAVLDAPEPNLLVFNCLVGSQSGDSWLFTGLPQDVIRQELMGMQKRLDWGADSTQARAILRLTWQWLGVHLDMSRYMR